MKFTHDNLNLRPGSSGKPTCTNLAGIRAAHHTRWESGVITLSTGNCFHAPLQLELPRPVEHVAEAAASKKLKRQVKAAMVSRGCHEQQRCEFRQQHNPLSRLFLVRLPAKRHQLFRYPENHRLPPAAAVDGTKTSCKALHGPSHLQGQGPACISSRLQGLPTELCKTGLTVEVVVPLVHIVRLFGDRRFSENASNVVGDSAFKLLTSTFTPSTDGCWTRLLLDSGMLSTSVSDKLKK